MCNQIWPWFGNKSELQVSKLVWNQKKIVLRNWNRKSVKFRKYDKRLFQDRLPHLASMQIWRHVVNYLRTNAFNSFEISKWISKMRLFLFNTAAELVVVHSIGSVTRCYLLQNSSIINHCETGPKMSYLASCEQGMKDSLPTRRQNFVRFLHVIIYWRCRWTGYNPGSQPAISQTPPPPLPLPPPHSYV